MLNRNSTVLLAAVISFFAGCANEALDPQAKEGDVLWRHVVGENIESSTTVDEYGNIYTTGGGYLWSFASDGNLRWKTCPLDEGCKGVEQGYPYALGVASSPAASPDGKKVYITGYAGVFAFDTSDGKLLWKKTVFDDYYEFAEKDFEGQAKMWKKTASTGYPQMFATAAATSSTWIRVLKLLRMKWIASAICLSVTANVSVDCLDATCVGRTNTNWPFMLISFFSI